MVLTRCSGRVLAADIRAIDLPAFDNSSVDGFAVMAADLSASSARRPLRLRVIADIPAGSAPKVRLRPGLSARIMTGAPLPGGADAVVMLEDTDASRAQVDAARPAWVTVHKPVERGENVRRRATHLKRGQKVLISGRRLRPQDLGMLAMLNVPRVKVFRRPRVALLSSGNELGLVGRAMGSGKIPDSNSHTLAALVADAGCEVLSLGIARDQSRAIRARLDRAVHEHVDLILSSAGVSVGALDLVRRVVESRGQLDFWRVNVRPGKPLAVGTYRAVPFIGLPGNPVSAFVGFELFVRPALARLAGLGVPRQRIVHATLAEPVKSDGRESYLRANVSERDGRYALRLAGDQGSANLYSLVQANALLIIPAGVKSLAVGDRVRAWLV